MSVYMVVILCINVTQNGNTLHQFVLGPDGMKSYAMKFKTYNSYLDISFVYSCLQ